MVYVCLDRVLYCHWLELVKPVGRTFIFVWRVCVCWGKGVGGGLIKSVEGHVCDVFIEPIRGNLCGANLNVLLFLIQCIIGVMNVS